MKKFIQFLFVWFGSLTTLLLVVADFDEPQNLSTSVINAPIEIVEDAINPPPIPDAFIFVPVLENYELASNGAYYVNGSTSNNCGSILVEASNLSAGLYDKYQLADYSYGDTAFKYGIRSDWNNLAEGYNTYTFTANCDHGLIEKASATLTYTVTHPSYNPSYESTTTSSETSDEVDYYTNSAGNTVQSPTYYDSEPAGASARCKDGTYSFSQSRSGTCSGHGGVSSWL